MFAQGKITTDRNVIQSWVTARQGWPAIIRDATSAGIELTLSIVFPGSSFGDIARKISWEEFFEKFDQQRLVFLYEEQDRNKGISLSYALI